MGDYVMKKILLCILILFPFFTNLYAQKKTATLAPMGALGELNELEKRVIFNSLQESLSKYYVLASQKMYEKAEEEAFQEMDADECTESQCIAIIQELLQTEFFFMFEIVKAGSFQQMKITRVDLDGNRDVRTETCDNCSISQVNGKVDGLVNKLTVSEETESTLVIEKEKTEIIDDKNDVVPLIFLGIPSLGGGSFGKGQDTIDYKQYGGYTLGVLYDNLIILYKIPNTEFEKKWDFHHFSSYDVNYKFIGQFVSFNYIFDNNYFVGYNHLLDGIIKENITVVRHVGNIGTYKTSNDYKSEGYGISIGYLYDLNEYFIGGYFDRNELKITSDNQPSYYSGTIITQGLSIGGGMQF